MSNELSDDRAAPSVGEPLPLVLVPGTLCDGDVFAPMLDGLDAICPDRPANRQGPRKAIVADFRDARDVRAAANAILEQAPQRFVLVGFSLGGIIALELAAIAPHRIAGLVLIGTTARAVARELHAERWEAANTGAKDVGWHVGTTVWGSYVAPSSQGDELLRARIVAMALRGGAQALLDHTAIALSRPDSRPRLHHLTMPVLVIAGREDAINPPEIQQELASGIPAAALALIDNAGHFVTMETADAVAHELQTWMRQNAI